MLLAVQEPSSAIWLPAQTGSTSGQVNQALRSYVAAKEKFTAKRWVSSRTIAGGSKKSLHKRV